MTLPHLLHHNPYRPRYRLSMSETRAALFITRRFERAVRFGAGWSFRGRSGLAGPDFIDGGVFMEGVKHTTRCGPSMIADISSAPMDSSSKRGA